MKVKREKAEYSAEPQDWGNCPECGEGKLTYYPNTKEITCSHCDYHKTVND